MFKVCVMRSSRGGELLSAPRGIDEDLPGQSASCSTYWKLLGCSELVELLLIEHLDVLQYPQKNADSFQLVCLQVFD